MKEDWDERIYRELRDINMSMRALHNLAIKESQPILALPPQAPPVPKAEEPKKESAWYKKLLWILLVVIILLIVFYIVKDWQSFVSNIPFVGKWLIGIAQP